MDEKELFQNGIREYRSGNYQKAEDFLQKSLEIDDQNPKVWNTLGIVLTSQGRHDDATICFENALILDPGNETFEKNNRINDRKRNSADSIKTQKSNSNSSNKATASNEGYIEKIKEFLLNPQGAIEKVKNENWTESLFFILPLFIIYGILSGIVFGANTNIITIIILIFVIIIGGIIGLFLNLIMTHLGVILFSGGNNVGWEGTFKAIAYSLIPILLIGWIPIVGQLIGGLWALFIIVVCLKQIHSLSTIRAILCLLGIFIVVGLIVMSAAIIAAFVFGMAGSTQNIDKTPPININPSTPIPTTQQYQATQIITPTPIKTIQSDKPITVPYNDLLREPEKYEGKNIEIEGVVIQAIDDLSIVQSKMGSDGQNIMVITNFESAMYGAISENYLLVCIDRPLGKRVIKGDELKLVYTSMGLYTYQTAEGAIATVPTGIVKSGTIY